MKKVGLADWRTSNGLPSASDPETEADRTPRESSLACMTANHEPSNQGFEIDREATVCAASRRFLPLCGRDAARTGGTSLVGRCLFGSLSALGLGCSLIPGARWLCRPLCPRKRTSLSAIAIWTPFAARWGAQQRRDKPYHARRSLDG